MVPPNVTLSNSDLQVDGVTRKLSTSAKASMKFQNIAVFDHITFLCSYVRYAFMHLYIRVCVYTQTFNFKSESRRA